jgi:hypothetical protein
MYKPPKIKKSHEGLFTAQAKAAGMSIRNFANKVLVPGSKASKATKSRAQFYKNFNG